MRPTSWTSSLRPSDRRARRAADAGAETAGDKLAFARASPLARACSRIAVAVDPRRTRWTPT
jgi:hypothetical protein